MSWFFTIFLLIYTGMHLEIYFRVRPLLPAGWRVRLALAAGVVPLILAPIAARMTDAWGCPDAAPYFAWPGYLWMGFIIVGFFLCLLFWLSELLLWVARVPRPAKRNSAWAFLVLAVCLNVYGVWEAHHLTIERVTIESPKLTAEHPRVRIALFSDLHLGPIWGNQLLEKVAKLVSEQKPDLILAGGDIVDGDLSRHDGAHEIMASMQAPLGKFAVLGNHEFYAGLGRSLEFFDGSGFVMLRNQARTLDGVLNLAGVDDPGRGRGQPDEPKALAPVQNGLFTVLLKHRPEVDPNSRGMFDLQLSGHSHGGQIFPFRLLVAMVYPMVRGLYHLSWGGWVYVGVGAGTWGPPLRIWAPPEITIVDIVRPGAKPTAGVRKE